MVNNYEHIRRCAKRLKFSSHAKEEMLSEEFGEIYEHEVRKVLLNGEIIEEYPHDRPYPSFLVYGRTQTNRPLHVVCAPIPDEETLVIITVYQPHPDLWEDLRRRRR